jgi:phenylacetate-CoA ligase
MNRRLRQIYYGLPGWARSAAATAEGLRLNWWRWGKESEDLVAEALERESWSAERWRSWQLEQLAERLDHAARKAPYYRQYWSSRRQCGDRRSWERLEHWPLLEKDAVRRFGSAFVAEDESAGPYRIESTSGTTGTPLRLWRTRRTLIRRYAIYEARHRRWYGVSRGQRWAMAGCQLVAEPASVKPPFWVWNAAMRQLYVSAYHLASEQAAVSLAAIKKYRCRYAWGYPSSLALLAQGRESGMEAPQLSCVVTNAEPLLTSQRSVIEGSFGCRAYETYGLVELVAAAGQCQAGSLHWFPEFGYVEALGPAGEPSLEEPGELVATSLLDSDMPLIRYRTGDTAALSPTPDPCGCGRGLPQLASIEGRCEDIVYSADGRPVARLDPVFKGDLPIREAQIVQERLGELLVVVAPSRAWQRSHEAPIAQSLRERLGDLDIRFETVAAIPRGANGKFRSIVSRLDHSPAAALAASSSR